MKDQLDKWMSEYLHLLEQPIKEISVVESSTATCGADVVGMYEESLSLGYEGIILRKPDGKWKHGRSTLKEQFLLRMKPPE